METLVNKAIIDALKDALVQKGDTLAVAESVTGGVLQAVLSAATDASLFFQGGITAYNIGQKVLHLGVEPIHAQQCNCVSPIIAAQMALGAANMFRSQWGIGVTGYASPVPESGDALFAHCAICYNGQIVLAEKLEPSATDFFPVQVEYTRRVLELLLAQLNKKH